MCDPALKIDEKGVGFSSKDESGWDGGGYVWLLDEIDENLDENGSGISSVRDFWGDVFIYVFLSDASAAG